MKNHSESKLDRLLRAVAAAPNEQWVGMPFGFDTRVLAYWRAGADLDRGVARLLRRIVLMSLGVILIASAGAYRELNRDDPAEFLSDEDAIADSAIGGAFEQ